MNKRILISVVFVCALAIFLLYVFWSSGPHSSKATSIVQKLAQSESKATPSVPPVGSASSNTVNRPISAHEAHDAEVKREQSIFNAWMMTSITFYGKVVDENGTPISGAKAKMSPSDAHIFEPGGGINYERVTDSEGLFSISGIHGMGLAVDVSKDGYYLLPESTASFGYIKAARGLPPHTDPKDPAIFKLKKMGLTEPLIVVDKNVRLSRDGTPMRMDLHTGKTSQTETGDIQVEAWTHDKDSPANLNGPYNWRCRISVPAGGLVQRSGDQFDFEAPSNGYKNEDVIEMPATASGWSDQINQQYFLKLRGGQYALVNFTMHAGGDHFFTITSYLNPESGHRNLEYDPAKKATVP